MHELAIRVYYEDTDFSGLVYHASYLRFLERGRTELLRSLGIDQSALHRGADALAFAVRSMALDFLKPARMDDVVHVETRIGAVNGASLVLEQCIVRGQDCLLTASVRVVLIGSGKARRLPADLRARFEAANSGLSETTLPPKP